MTDLSSKNVKTRLFGLLHYTGKDTDRTNRTVGFGGRNIWLGGKSFNVCLVASKRKEGSSASASAVQQENAENADRKSDIGAVPVDNSVLKSNWEKVDGSAYGSDGMNIPSDSKCDKKRDAEETEDADEFSEVVESSEADEAPTKEFVLVRTASDKEHLDNILRYSDEETPVIRSVKSYENKILNTPISIENSKLHDDMYTNEKNNGNKSSGTKIVWNDASVREFKKGAGLGEAKKGGLDKKVAIGGESKNDDRCTSRNYSPSYIKSHQSGVRNYYENKFKNRRQVDTIKFPEDVSIPINFPKNAVETLITVYRNVITFLDRSEKGIDNHESIAVLTQAIEKLKGLGIENETLDKALLPALHPHGLEDLYLGYFLPEEFTDEELSFKATLFND